MCHVCEVARPVHVGECGSYVALAAHFRPFSSHLRSLFSCFDLFLLCGRDCGCTSELALTQLHIFGASFSSCIIFYRNRNAAVPYTHDSAAPRGAGRAAMTKRCSLLFG